MAARITPTTKRAYPILRGCDTFVAFPPSAPCGTVIFGKNSDRPVGEGQSIHHYPGSSSNDAKATTTVKCTYIEIPQAPTTYAIIVSQIDWMYGAEMGCNECGVCIGNEAVWTLEPDETNNPSLLGMDLVRLGLERGSTAREALSIITTLLEQYGQGGACDINDPTFTYHNSFLIVDTNEAWVLETAGKHWVAEKITSGSRNISNGLTIRAKFDLCSAGLQEYAKECKYWDGLEPFDFAKSFSDGPVDHPPSSRQVCGYKLLQEHDDKGTLDVEAMKAILRDHKSGICMHGGGFETTSSMISELCSITTQKNDDEHRRRHHHHHDKHWFTGRPYTCQNEFILHNFENQM